MGRYARAVTNESGQALLGDLDIQGMKTDPYQAVQRTVWTTPDSVGHSGVLGDLLADSDGTVIVECEDTKERERIAKYRERFDLLARHLRDKGLAWGTPITYGTIERTRTKMKGTVKFIVVGRDHYREIQGSIHHKRA